VQHCAASLSAIARGDDRECAAKCHHFSTGENIHKQFTNEADREASTAKHNLSEGILNGIDDLSHKVIAMPASRFSEGRRGSRIFHSESERSVE
jgi:hypothetical protein